MCVSMICPTQYVFFIMRYLANRMQIVKIMGEKIQWIFTSRRVPQGCVLGLHLFNLLINYLSQVPTDALIASFADDSFVCDRNADLTFLKRINLKMFTPLNGGF